MGIAPMGMEGRNRRKIRRAVPARKNFTKKMAGYGTKVRNFPGKR